MSAYSSLPLHARLIISRHAAAGPHGGGYGKRRMPTGEEGRFARAGGRTTERDCRHFCDSMILTPRARAASRAHGTPVTLKASMLAAEEGFRARMTECLTSTVFFHWRRILLSLPNLLAASTCQYRRMLCECHHDADFDDKRRNTHFSNNARVSALEDIDERTSGKPTSCRAK